MILSGIQFFIFGLLGDLMVSLQKDAIEALKGERKK
jgi:hypothetical protein